MLLPAVRRLQACDREGVGVRHWQQLLHHDRSGSQANHVHRYVSLMGGLPARVGVLRAARLCSLLDVSKRCPFFVNVFAAWCVFGMVVPVCSVRSPCGHNAQGRCPGAHQLSIATRPPCVCIGLYSTRERWRLPSPAIAGALSVRQRSDLVWRLPPTHTPPPPRMPSHPFTCVL